MSSSYDAAPRRRASLAVRAAQEFVGPMAVEQGVEHAGRDGAARLGLRVVGREPGRILGGHLVRGGGAEGGLTQASWWSSSPAPVGTVSILTPRK